MNQDSKKQENTMTRRQAIGILAGTACAAVFGGLGILTGCNKNSSGASQPSSDAPQPSGDAPQPSSDDSNEKKSYNTKRIVFFFTGTGNSLYVAKTLSDNPVSIPQAMKSADMTYEAEEIGIVYPVYGQMPPNMVREFLKKAKLHCDYLFAVATYGNTKGGSVEILQNIARESKLEFHYIATLLMVDNWLPMFDMNEQTQIDKKIDENLAKIQADINARKAYIEAVSPEEHDKAVTQMQRTTGPFQGDGVHAKAEEWFAISDQCVGCGLCTRVCPRGNYRIDATQIAVTSGECELCFACIHACPHKAITIASGEKNPKARFRNPNVKVSEIQKANKK